MNSASEYSEDIPPWHQCIESQNYVVGPTKKVSITVTMLFKHQRVMETMV